jgi:hypothetical protein
VSADLQLRFARGSASTSELRGAIETALLTPVADGPPDSVTVTEDQAIDPLTATVTITLVKLAGHIAANIWDDVIWPRVRRELGDDALGERKDR